LVVGHQLHTAWPLSSYWHFFWLQVTFWLTVVVPAALLTSTDTEPLVRRP